MIYISNRIKNGRHILILGLFYFMFYPDAGNEKFVKIRDKKTGLLLPVFPGFLRFEAKIKQWVILKMARGDFKNKDKETLAAYGRKGALKAAEVKRQKKDLREMVNTLLCMPLKPGAIANIEELRTFASLKGKNLTVEQAMIVQQISKAIRGDTKAMQIIIKLSGKDMEEW